MQQVSYCLDTLVSGVNAGIEAKRPLQTMLEGHCARMALSEFVSIKLLLRAASIHVQGLHRALLTGDWQLCCAGSMSTLPVKAAALQVGGSRTRLGKRRQTAWGPVAS